MEPLRKDLWINLLRSGLSMEEIGDIGEINLKVFDELIQVEKVPALEALNHAPQLLSRDFSQRITSVLDLGA